MRVATHNPPGGGRQGGGGEREPFPGARAAIQAQQHAVAGEASQPWWVAARCGALEPVLDGDVVVFAAGAHGGQQDVRGDTEGVVRAHV